MTHQSDNSEQRTAMSSGGAQRRRRRRNPFAESVDDDGGGGDVAVDDDGVCIVGGEDERDVVSPGRPGNPFQADGRGARGRRNPFASESEQEENEREEEDDGSLKASTMDKQAHADGDRDDCGGGDDDAGAFGKQEKGKEEKEQQQQQQLAGVTEHGKPEMQREGSHKARADKREDRSDTKGNAVVRKPTSGVTRPSNASRVKNLLFEEPTHNREEEGVIAEHAHRDVGNRPLNLSVLMPSSGEEEEENLIDEGGERRYHEDLFSSPPMSPLPPDEAPSGAILEPANVRRAAARPSVDTHNVGELRTMVVALLQENKELKTLLRQKDGETTSSGVQRPAPRRVSPRDAFLAISRGQDCSLEPYRPIEEKMRLADLAERIGGGVATTRVALFLAATLKRSVFMQILNARPRLCRHYINCLRHKGDWHTAHSVARAANMHHIADDVLLRHVFASSDPQQTLERMASALRELAHHGRKETATLLRQDKVLLSMQLAMEEQDTSPSAVASSPTLQGRPAHARLPLTSATTTVFYSALYHYEDKRDAAGSYTSVVDTLNMHEKLVQASAMRALIQRRDWSQLQQLFTTKSLFRSAKLAPRISPSHIVEALIRAQAPQEEITRYLPLVKDVEMRFRLAKKAQAHDAAIDALVEMKDVEALRSYSLCQGVTTSRALSNRVAALLRDTKHWAK